MKELTERKTFSQTHQAVMISPILFEYSDRILLAASVCTTGISDPRAGCRFLSAGNVSLTTDAPPDCAGSILGIRLRHVQIIWQLEGESCWKIQRVTATQHSDSFFL
jgi:hypothetical protein